VPKRANKRRPLYKSGERRTRTGDREELYDTGEQVLNCAESVGTGSMPTGQETLSMAKHHMEQPGGKGVAARKPSRDNTGKTDTDLHDMGKEWPRKHKNSGGGVGERFKGSKHPGSDMSGGHGPKGNSSEAVTPDDIASLMEDDGAQLQELFDAYAKRANTITLSEFREYAQAYGMPVADENILLSLMGTNQEFMFNEHSDAQGRFWVPTLITEMDYSVDDPLTHSRRFSSKRNPNDFARPDDSMPGGEGNAIGGGEFDDFGGEGDLDFGGEGDLGSAGGDFGGEGDLGSAGGDFGGGGEFGGEGEFGSEGDFGGEGEYGDEAAGPWGAADDYDEGVYSDQNDAGMAADFGEEMPPDEAEYSDLDDDMSFYPPEGEPIPGGRRPRAGIPGTDDDWMEGRIRGGLTNTIYEADGSLSSGIGGPIKLKTHEGPPADHGDYQMDSPEGESVSQRKPNKKSGLPQEPTDLSDMGKEWPRKQRFTGTAQEREHESKHGEPNDGYQSKVADLNLKTKQKNTGTSWEEFENYNWGSNKLDWGKVGGGAKQMHENVRRLAQHVTGTLQRYMTESGGFRQAGKYPVQFVVGAGDWVRARAHRNLTEALTDVEELLQIFGPEHVRLEARIEDGYGMTVMRKTVPLIGVTERGPVMAENRAIFRYPELARDFADVLVQEGKVCRAVAHNWGAAIAAKLPYGLAARVFNSIREES
jgi:hypothetical protein